MSSQEEYSFDDVFTYGDPEPESEDPGYDDEEDEDATAGAEMDDYDDEEEEDATAGAEMDDYDSPDPSGSDYSHATSISSDATAGATHGSNNSIAFSDTSSAASSYGTVTDDEGSAHATSAPIAIPGAQIEEQSEPDQAVVGSLSDTPLAPIHGFGGHYGR